MNKRWKNDGINNEKMLRFNEKMTEVFSSLLPEIPVNLQQVHVFFRGFFTCFLGIFSNIFSLIFAYIFCWFFRAFSFFFFTYFSFFFSQEFLLKIKFKFNYLYTNYVSSSVVLFSRSKIIVCQVSVWECQMPLHWPSASAASHSFWFS